MDDKLQTKKIALDGSIAVPTLCGTLGTEYQAKHIGSMLEPYADFAIKPSRGSGGEGILVITGRSKRLYRKADGTLLPPEEINYHLFNIISDM